MFWALWGIKTSPPFAEGKATWDGAGTGSGGAGWGWDAGEGAGPPRVVSQLQEEDGDALVLRMLGGQTEESTVGAQLLTVVFW